MKRRQIGRALLVIGLAVGLRGAPARAAGAPLLVVVEAAPDLEMDAGEVRRAIGAELHEATVAPAKIAADSPGRTLIVAVDRQRITMSVREGGAEPIARAIPTPPDPAARLRAIAWLAGNLARDQVTGVLAQPPATGATPAPPAPEPPPPPPAPALEPPRFEARAATIATHPQPGMVRTTEWTLGAVAGPAISLYDTVHSLRQSIFGAWNLGSSLYDVFGNASTVWRVEARHQNIGSRTFTGLALEGGRQTYGRGEAVGAQAFAGTTRQLGRWTFAAGLGAGVDLDQQPITGYASTGNSISTTVTFELRPGLFAAGNVSVSYPLSESFDAALGVDAHVSVTDEYDSYLATMLGLRYRLR